MADFVAVIRRAVDGLSNNTPEMRAKVYDKARGAVLRQLENMSPRPPEDMIRRQMDKLTAAISEVEAEHAVALPAVSEHEVHDLEPVAEALPEPQAEQLPPEPEPEPQPEPVAADEHSYDQHQPAPDDYNAPLSEPTAPDVDSPGTPGGSAPYPVFSDRPSPAFASADDWMSEPFGVRKENDVSQAPAAVTASFEPPVEAAPVSDFAYRDAYSAPVVETMAEEHEPSPDLLASLPASVEPLGASSRVEPIIPDELPVIEPRKPTRAETDVAYDAWASFPASGTPAQGSNDLGTDIDWPPQSPARPSPPEDDFDAYVNSVSAPQPAKPAEGPAMPAAIDLLDWHDELASLPPLNAGQPAAATAAAAPAPALAPVGEAPPRRVMPPAPAPPVPPRRDSLDDLLGDSIGLPGASASAAPKGSSIETTDIDDFLASAQQSAYRQETKPRRNLVPLILGLAVLILLGGGGYAVWANREEINAFVSGLTESASDLVSSSSTETPAETPVTTPAASDAPPATTETAALPANGAPEEGVATVQKFTQRLRPDGTEIDEGAAGANGATGEGRSVAQQNVAPNGDGSATPSAPAGTPPASNGATTAPAAQTTPLTVGSQERAFLYEERLGQVSPTAIVGGIEWTVMRDNGPDGRPDPAIQGRLSIPERGLNALITFRRNNDSSLPASHLVEIVFSMPADFEGGAIDAVQRVSFKRTEQDRGDPLVGVAAKVTDDTFLIALNDFQDVVARNMDLIGNRSWIDIPITYRNGRRALLTLDKGTNGTALFQQVVREWAALTPAAPAN